MLAGEFVTLAGLTVLSILGLLAASALSWMAWLTVLSLLFIQGADTFLALKDLGLVRLCKFALPYGKPQTTFLAAMQAFCETIGWHPECHECHSFTVERAVHSIW